MKLKAVLLAVLFLTSAGCGKSGPRSEPKPLETIKLLKGQSFTAPVDGWFLTDNKFDELTHD